MWIRNWLGVFVKLCQSLSALEYGKENIRLLKKQDIKYASIYEGDAQNMPFEDQKFELISLAMIYYLSINKFLEECSRVLKDRGILFFVQAIKMFLDFVQLLIQLNIIQFQS